MLENNAAATEHGTRSQCCQVIQEELVVKNFFFDFQPEEVFYNSQWKMPKAVYITYRLILVAYATTALILSIVIITPNTMHRPWPVWLTHWSYFLLTVHLYMALISSLLHFRYNNFHSHLDPDLYYGWNLRRWSRPYVRLNWFVFVVASAAAFIVSIIYFGALYPKRHVNYLSAVDINLHLMNSVIVILEFCVSAFPVRLLHFVYVIIYGGLYAMFSVVYWSFDHSNVLYPGVLDWNNPGRTAIFVVLLAFIGIPILHCLLFCLYRLRIWSFHKFYSRHLF